MHACNLVRRFHSASLLLHSYGSLSHIKNIHTNKCIISVQSFGYYKNYISCTYFAIAKVIFTILSTEGQKPVLFNTIQSEIV